MRSRSKQLNDIVGIFFDIDPLDRWVTAISAPVWNQELPSLGEWSHG
jgi:hypothetical protein